MAKAKTAEPEYPRADLASADNGKDLDRYGIYAEYVAEQTGMDVDPVILRAAIVLYQGFQRSDLNREFNEQRRNANAANREERSAAYAEKRAAAAAKKEEREKARAEREAARTAKAEAAAAKKAAAPAAKKSAPVTDIGDARRGKGKGKPAKATKAAKKGKAAAADAPF